MESSLRNSSFGDNNVIYLRLIYKCCECCKGFLLLYNLILRNEPGIVSLMSVVTVRGVVNVIRAVDPVVNP